MSDDDKNEETVTDENQQSEPEPDTPDEGVKEEGKAPEPEQPKQRRGRKPAKQEPVLDLGRMVRYVTISETVRPAVVTAIHNGGAEGIGSVDLTVFNSQGAVPVVNVEHGDDHEPHTWHWPEFN